MVSEELREMAEHTINKGNSGNGGGVFKEVHMFIEEILVE